MRRGTDEEMERDRDRDRERERNAVVRLVRASSSTGCTSSLLYLRAKILTGFLQRSLVGLHEALFFLPTAAAEAEDGVQGGCHDQG